MGAEQSLQELEKSDTDYQIISRNANVSVLKIYRVNNNPKLVEAFNWKKKLQPHAKIRQLYHGTKHSNVPSILSDNLKLEYVKDAKFGAGISFATHAAYALNYCDSNENDEGAIFLFDVIVGDCCLGVKDTRPDLGEFDTTCNSQQTVFVKYEENTYLPKYLIMARKKPVVQSPASDEIGGNLAQEEESGIGGLLFGVGALVLGAAAAYVKYQEHEEEKKRQRKN